MVYDTTMQAGRRPPLDVLVELDALLDEALRQTFPASDPIAVNVERIRKSDRAQAECKSARSNAETAQPAQARNDKS